MLTRRGLFRRAAQAGAVAAVATLPKAAVALDDYVRPPQVTYQEYSLGANFISLSENFAQPDELPSCAESFAKSDVLPSL